MLRSRSVRNALLLACLTSITACAGETPATSPECTDPACLEAYDPASDGKADASGNDLYDITAAEIQARYGVRPRRYNGFFNDSNWGEERFRAALPQVTTFVNEALASRGTAAEVDEVAVAINFITEGGYFALDLEGLKRTIAMSDPDAAESIPTWDEVEASGSDLYVDGFTFFGVDTLVDNFAALRPFMPPDIVELVDSGTCVASSVNERGETVRSLNCLTIEQGLYANAGMFAWARERAAIAIGTSEFAALDAVGQFFWSTVFFNAGPGTGQRVLADNGVDYYRTAWTSSDDASRWATNPKFNASWRTASYEFMRDTVFSPDDLPGEGVCRWADMYDLGNTRDEAKFFAPIDDVGSATIRGYFPGDDTQDWVGVDVTESSRELGMCALVTLANLPDDYSLCAYYERSSDPLEACSNNPGTTDEEISLDLDRFARDDSGQLFIVVSREDAPAAVCDGYELSWSVSVGRCP